MATNSSLFQSGKAIGKVGSGQNTASNKSLLFKSGEAVGKVSDYHKSQEDINHFVLKSSPISERAFLPSANKLKEHLATEKLKTIIPSKTYDADAVKKNDISVSERLGGKNLSEYLTLETAKDKQKNNQPLTLSERIALKNEPIESPNNEAYISVDKNKFSSEAAVNRAKSKIKRDKLFYYSSLPNGTVKSTNPTKKQYGLTFDNSIDWKYEYINDINGTRTLIDSLAARGGGGREYNIYRNINEREVGIYNYLYQTEGKEKAEEFLDFIEIDLDSRLNEDAAKRNKKFAENYPILSSVISPIVTMASAGEQIVNYGEFLFTGKMKTNKSSTAVSTIRNTVSEKVDWEIGNWDAFDFVYNTVMSGADSLAVSSFGVAGAVALGLSAAGSATNDILARGGDNIQAFFGGVAAGVFEGFFEKFSIGQLNAMQDSTVKGFKDYALNLVKSIGTNFSEETATEIANILYDYAVNGGISNYSIMIQEFIDSGDSLENAKKKAAQKLGLQVLEAGASGALMGAGFASITSAVNYKNYKDNPDYQKAKSNEEILGLINKVKKGDFKANDKVYLKNPTSEIAKTIQQITGIDVSEFKVAIEARQIEHILKDHGSEGKTDNSLSNDIDISKMEYVLSKPDDIRKAGKTQAYSYMKDGKNRTADTVLYEKVLADNSYYVVQAVPDAKAKTLYVVTAFIGESGYKKEALQLTDANSPSATPLSGSVIASNNNIPQGENVVNNNIFIPQQNNSQNSNTEILSVRKKSKQRRHTTAKEQDFIKRFAEALGVKLEFTHITAEHLRNLGYEFNDGDILPDGYYDKDTKTIHIGYTVYDPVTFIFKHELTHFGEGTAQYKKFVETVKKSKTFKNWLAKQIGYKKVADAEEYYLFKIAKERGYKLNGEGVLSESDRNELKREMIADFVGDCIFTEDTAMFESMLSDLDPKERNAVIQYIRDFLSYLIKKLAGNKDIVFEISRLEDNFNRMLSEAVQTKEKPPTESGENLQFSIVNLDNGKSYVQASRKVISGNSVAEWRSQISEFFNRALKNGPIEIQTIEGDVLTISKETANKARDKHISENGISRELSDNEFRVKLNAESHIDELSEISLSNKDAEGNKKIISDKKNHEIARDGFSYRTVYFQDFDGAYYRITLSVGENNNISTVYNVGKIKAEDIPNGNIVSAIGSKADMSSANSSVTQNLTAVNNNSMQESGNNSKKLQFSFARVQDENLISKAEEREEELLSKGKNWVITQLEIWDELGIIRDAAGEWIYEIDDSAMEFFPLGDAERELDPEIEELIKLENAKRLTDEKKKRFHELLNKYNYSIFRSGKLSDFIKHPKLFKKFPQLRDVNFKIDILKDDAKGGYIPETNTIVIDYAKIVDIQENLKKSKLNKSDDAYIEIEKYIIHEIQHALQEIEDREPGSSEEYWNKRYAREGKSQIKPDTGQELSAYGAYFYTKGEFEARETANRYKLTEKQRKGVFGAPYLGWGETISARDTVGVHSAEFSVPTDAEYIQAVEKGDINQLQEMVDNAARSNGYTERLYHQTGAEFTEFNTDNQVAGKFDWQLPTGIFLKPSDNDIGLKGKKQMELFARTNNPLRFNDRSEAQEFWSERIEGYSEAVAEVEKIDNEYREKDDDAIMELQSYMRQWKKENPDAQKHDIYNDAKYQRLADKESGIMDEWELKSDKASIKAKRLIDNFIANSDYDGIIIERDDDGKNRHTKSYVVFDSSQLKSAALVTYDNEGNVITLSERFNQEKKDIRFSVPSLEEVDSYSEEQYNNFGWVRANNVLSSTEYETLLSRYADYKHNDDKYPTTRFGEAVIFSFDHPSVVMYVKGSIETPEITKVIKMISDIPLEIQSDIQKEIIENERNKVLLPWENVTSIFGEGLFTVNKKRDFKSFQEYERGRQGKISQGDSTNNRDEHNGTGSKKQNISNSEAGLNKPAFSMPRETSELLDMYESGEITRVEYLGMLNRKDTLNPVEIANLSQKDADTTAVEHSRKQGESNGDGESKFYESLMKSEIFDLRFKDEIKDDSFIERYKTITNKEALKTAVKELDMGGRNYVERWWAIKPERASLIDTAVGFILMDRYQRINDYEQAVAVAEKVREFGTASGQQVQIFSIIGRFNPDMMVAYAQKELSRAFEVMVDGKTKKWIDNNKDKFNLTVEEIEFIRRHTLQAALFEDDTRPKAVALGKITTMLQDKIPSQKGDGIKAWQRISMLLNPRTNLRNINGNAGMVGVFIASDFFGSGIDKIISKKTGIRTTGNFDIKSVKGFKKGVYETLDDFKRGIHTKQEELNRFDVNSKTGKNFNEHGNGLFGKEILTKQLNGCARFLNKLDNFTSFCLEAGDRPFFEMWYINALNNQLKLNDIDIPTTEMMELAKEEALQRTWQDDNTFTRAASQIRKSFNIVHLPNSTYGLGDFIYKFIKTPTNIAKAIVEFSPVGFVGAASNAIKLKNAIETNRFNPQMQKEYVRSLSNAITGTLLYTLVVIGASLGLVKLSGDGDDDKDVANYEKYILGIPPYSIEFLGVDISYDWLQPFGSILAVVAEFIESREEDTQGNVAGDVLEAIKAGGKVFAQQSFLQGLYDLCSSEDWIEGVTNIALAEPSVYIPQALSQTASFFDPYRRNSYDASNGFNNAVNKMIAKIPGLRNTLAKQKNTLGEDAKNPQYLNPWLSFASPWNTYPKSSNEVVEDIYKLYKESGDKSVMPRVAPNYVEVKENRITFSPQQKSDFQKSMGDQSVQMLTELFSSNQYLSLSDQQKVKVVGRIYSFSYANAKSELKFDYQTLSAMVGKYKNGQPILTEQEYERLPQEARKMLAQEYFLSKTEIRYLNDNKRLVEYYINQSKQ